MLNTNPSFLFKPTSLIKKLNYSNTVIKNKIIITVDAGHGGQDPGAIGKNNVQEKNVNLSIANKLKTLLNKTEIFKSIMIRKGNYFIPIPERINIAKKKI